jgi:hypothetical protein
MESTAQSVEDYLIDGLSFKLQPGASYITQRRSVTFFPSGAGTFSPSGTKVIRVALNGEGWADLSTLRCMYNLNNNGTNVLMPISGPWSFIRRVRVLVGGTLVEDIDYYNKVHEQFSLLQSQAVRDNDSIEGFGFDSYAGDDIIKSTDVRKTIVAGASEPVSFKLAAGITSQNKLIPLRYAPITLELKCVNTPTECIMEAVLTGSGTDKTHGSVDWSIDNFQIKVDVCSLDNELENSYAQHLLSGKTLPVSYSTYVTQLQAVTPNSSISINIQRAFTRLKTVFVSLVNSNLLNFANSKEFNSFYHPCWFTNGAYATSMEFETQIQVGSRLFPEYPMRSSKENFAQLRKTLGIQSSTFHSISIRPEEYSSSRHIIALDFEKTLQAGWSGLNTKSGDLMTVKFNRMPTSLGAIVYCPERNICSDAC